jgi:hypothetical protein
MLTSAFARFVPLGMAAMLTVGPQSSQLRGNDHGVGTYLRAVGEYLALRERLFAPLPPLEVSDNWETIHNAVEARTHALRRARVNARNGDIFNVAVAELFRSQIRRVMDEAGYDAGRLLREMTDDGEQWQPAEANGRFSWTTACATPPFVLAALPPLPDQLQYRFVGLDLALIDTDASYIVDVLRDALAARAAKPGRADRPH